MKCQSRVYNGEYELHNLDLGPHNITVKADGYQPMQRYTDLGVGKNVSNFDFSMNPIKGQTLAGAVLLSNGEAAPNVMISLFRMVRMVPRILQGSQTSSSDGRFQFKNVPPGEYKISLNAVGFPQQVYPQEMAEEPITDLKLQLLRDGMVSGRIIVPAGSHMPEKPVVLVGTDSEAKGKSTSFKEIGETLPFGFVMLRPGGLRRHTARLPESDLKFRMENILPGEYWASLWDNTPQIISLNSPPMRAPVMPPQKIEIKEGADTQIELRLPKYGKLEGKVTNAQTGAPIANATVLAVNGESHVFSRGAISDSDGRYSIHVVPGRYEKMEVSTHKKDASRRPEDVYSFKTGGFSVESGRTVRMDMKITLSDSR